MRKRSPLHENTAHGPRCRRLPVISPGAPPPIALAPAESGRLLAQGLGLKPKTVLILNASLGGASGNTAGLLTRATRLLQARARVETVTLTSAEEPARLRPLFNRAQAFLVATGTHWDSWSSHLQRFLEASTPWEGSATWLGKPAAFVVTEHSVGGKGVLSRLQGVFGTLGVSLPPMSGLVYARAAHLARCYAPRAATEDFWCPADLEIVCHNLLEALYGTQQWRTWDVDRTDFQARWIKTTPRPRVTPPAAGRRSSAPAGVRGGKVRARVPGRR